jgi:O-methyltransferase involved in polyketide biosynthesis
MTTEKIQKNPILRDPWAEEAMRQIDYDMSKTLKGVSSGRMEQDRTYHRRHASRDL